jgi:hypothetical protein
MPDWIAAIVLGVGLLWGGVLIFAMWFWWPSEKAAARRAPYLKRRR